MGRIGARLLGHIRRLVCGIGAALCVAALALAGSFERWEHLWLDQLFELRGVRPPTAPIVIVNIDESTFQEVSLPWPFPRALHVKLIDRISAERPIAIGVDVIFDGPSMFGPRDADALGAAITRAGNVVLVAAGAQEDQGYDSPVARAPRTSARAGWLSRACRRTGRPGRRSRFASRAAACGAGSWRTPRLFQDGATRPESSSRHWTRSRRPRLRSTWRAGGRARAMGIDVDLGGTALRTIIGSLLLMASVAGCAESGASAPPPAAATAQKECERSGGTWRGTRCESSAGGGY